MVESGSAAHGELGVAVGTGTLPPLPGFALSSAQPVTSITTTTAQSATIKTMIRAVFVKTGTGADHRSRASLVNQAAAPAVPMRLDTAAARNAVDRRAAPVASQHAPRRTPLGLFLLRLLICAHPQRQAGGAWA
jgi:hypothetical protein